MYSWAFLYLSVSLQLAGLPGGTGLEQLKRHWSYKSWITGKQSMQHGGARTGEANYHNGVDFSLDDTYIIPKPLVLNKEHTHVLLGLSVSLSFPPVFWSSRGTGLEQFKSHGGHKSWITGEKSVQHGGTRTWEANYHNRVHIHLLKSE